MPVPGWMWGVVMLCFCVAIFYKNKRHDDDDHKNNQNY